jgi:YHS domain-containing protein
VGLAGETRDPVCGRRVDPTSTVAVDYEGKRYLFCSESCRSRFSAVERE